MPRFVTLTVAIVAVLALFSAGGYVLGRWYEWDAVAQTSAFLLKGSLWAIGGACAYACLVGIYHTFLSITGLDEEPEPPEDAGGAR